MKILIAIPVHNEEKYVTRVLEKIRHHAVFDGSAADILAIDDGSTDKTPALLTALPVDVIRHAHNRGYGASIRDGFRFSQCYCYDWLITMDCDEQHEPEALADFYSAIKRGQSDIISGSRYMPQSRASDCPPPERQKVNKAVTGWLNETLGFKLTDAFCGYKAYRVSALKHLEIDRVGYEMPLQAWVQAAAAGLAVEEVPVRLIYNDPNRSFGGDLDDSAIRLAHYRQAFEQELDKFQQKFPNELAGAAKEG